MSVSDALQNFFDAERRNAFDAANQGVLLGEPTLGSAADSLAQAPDIDTIVLWFGGGVEDTVEGLVEFIGLLVNNDVDTETEAI